MKSKYKIPKILKKVKLPPKPEPDLSINVLDRFRLWLDNSLESVVMKVIGWVVPTWVWLSFLGGLFLIVGLYVVLK